MNTEQQLNAIEDAAFALGVMSADMLDVLAAIIEVTLTSNEIATIRAHLLFRRVDAKRQK